MEQVVQELSVLELAEKIKNHDKIFLLDVREPREVAICTLDGAVHIPMNMIPLNMDKIPDEQDIVIYCHHGVRSLSVAHYLIEAGFDAERIYNLAGGIDQWAKNVDRTMAIY
ncbi:rhodanese-like domain-containing protein [Zophobihabitans entericus]|uniref:Sulfurtransferase n=1 Tax=Zophobihabitans entericus TaxID=1635327 RepID=A0A6G9IDE6_9GAMM|nr:rhodanese-like domain-containing protein [Zophobihabitans entericus]QIQ22258.1 sulfurtransferase [Zophobihabitans entericus]